MSKYYGIITSVLLKNRGKWRVRGGGDGYISEAAVSAG